MPDRGPRGVARLVRAAGYSRAGLLAAIRHEEAFRQELALAAVLVPLGVYLGHTGGERALLAGSVVLVLIVELLNSAVEAAVDRVGAERHTLSARAKDLGSAAVAVALTNVLLVWALVLW